MGNVTFMFCCAAENLPVPKQHILDYLKIHNISKFHGSAQSLSQSSTHNMINRVRTPPQGLAVHQGQQMRHGTAPGCVTSVCGQI